MGADVLDHRDEFIALDNWEMPADTQVQSIYCSNTLETRASHSRRTSVNVVVAFIKTVGGREMS